MKGETKRKASNAKLETSLAPYDITNLTRATIHFCILYCNNFLRCVVKGLGEFLRFAEPLVSFMRCICNAKVRTINYSKS